MKIILILTLLISGDLLAQRRGGGAPTGGGSPSGGFGSAPAKGSHFLVLGFDANTNARFKDGARSSTPNQSFDSEIEFETSSGYGYEYRLAPPCTWGMGVGVIKQNKSMVIGVKEDGQIQFDYDKDEIEMYTFYLDGLMRFRKFFFSLGFNKSMMDFKAEDSSIDVDSSNKMGFNFGMGWYLTEWVVLEYGIKTSPWKLRKTESDGTITDFGDGNIEVSSLQLKVRFW